MPSPKRKTGVSKKRVKPASASARAKGAKKISPAVASRSSTRAASVHGTKQAQPPIGPPPREDLQSPAEYAKARRRWAIKNRHCQECIFTPLPKEHWNKMGRRIKVKTCPDCLKRKADERAKREENKRLLLATEGTDGAKLAPDEAFSKLMTATSTRRGGRAGAAPKPAPPIKVRRESPNGEPWSYQAYAAQRTQEAKDAGKCITCRTNYVLTGPIDPNTGKPTAAAVDLNPRTGKPYSTCTSCRKTSKKRRERDAA
jgi:ssDNA-binding Zn-finger/Zn-ribbon topoisomerase 1